MKARPNAELAYRVLDHINAHPEQHDQGTWITVGTDCGTVACFAGWTCLLAGDMPATPLFHHSNEVSRVTVVDDGNEDHAHDRTVKYRAAELLGLYSGEWRLLFYTRSDALPRVVAEIFGPRPRTCCSSTEDVGHDFTCPVMLANAGVALDYDDVAPNAGSAS